MQAEKILARADALFAAGEHSGAAEYMERMLAQARGEENWQVQLTLLNELMGYYRSLSQFERAFSYADEAGAILSRHQLEQTLAGVTTLLNIANLYRAWGRPGQALQLFRQVETVYRQQGLEHDLRLGGLYNNMAVACLEMGERTQALAYGGAAAAALQGAEDSAGERAVVYTNLASVLMKAEPPAEKEAEAYLEQALCLFEQEAAGDPHYGGALSAKAYLAFRQGREEEAIRLYRRAMEVTRAGFGENRDYQRLAANLQVLLERKERRG